MNATFRIDLPLVIPGLRDHEDSRIEVLEKALLTRAGANTVHQLIENGHTEEVHGAASLGGAWMRPQLCLHYDDAIISFGEGSQQ